jgi:hypothetical protein
MKGVHRGVTNASPHSKLAEYGDQRVFLNRPSGFNPWAEDAIGRPVRWTVLRELTSDRVFDEPQRARQIVTEHARKPRL